MLKWVILGYVGIWLLGIILIAVVVLLGGSFGDPVLDVLLLNDTAVPVRYCWQYTADVQEGGLIAPSSAARETFPVTGPTLRIIARTEDGAVVFDQTWAWKDLRQRPDRPVVIRITESKPQ